MADDISFAIGQYTEDLKRNYSRVVKMDVLMLEDDEKVRVMREE